MTRYILGELVKLYPKTFFLNGADRVPLKVGTTRELVAAGVGNKAELGVALSVYTSNRDYLEKMREGAVRIGLDGQPAGIVTAEDELAAIAKMIEIEAKTAAELQQCRQRRLEQKQRRRQAKAEKLFRPIAINDEPIAPPPAPEAPKRLGLSDLKHAWQERQATKEVQS